ncbi:hypothetical protein [Sporolactobacillus pectinivorans]|uniref:hypothetical protein n=1 Tax=Sporolactobacillus pectinivorans TaxID=1591408 RepID=UPI000C25CD18|nr:hypothetical protein [Sporolactobacillus pectinivorans]
MKQIYQIDTNELFVAPVIFDDSPVVTENEDGTTTSTVPQIPNDCVETAPPNGFYKPKWNGAEWLEGATQDYINSLHAAPSPNNVELLQQQNAQLLLQSAQQAQTISDLQNQNAAIMLQLAQIQPGGAS